VGVMANQTIGAGLDAPAQVCVINLANGRNNAAVV